MRILLLAFLLLTATTCLSKPGKDELLNQLDRELSKKDAYDQVKEQRIKQLKTSLNKASGNLRRSF